MIRVCGRHAAEDVRALLPRGCEWRRTDEASACDVCAYERDLDTARRAAADEYGPDDP